MGVSVDPQTTGLAPHLQSQGGKEGGLGRESLGLRCTDERARARPVGSLLQS